MSSQITTAFVQQYKAEVMHLSQQKGSKLAPNVRNESQQGKSAFYDRLGKALAQEKTSRHADTPQIDSEHSRRRVTLKDYVWADLIDKEDLRRLLMDPAGPYAQAAVWGMGRQKDLQIIAAANGSAWGGEDGSTEVVMPSSQKLQASNGTIHSNANIFWLRKIKEKFDGNDVDESIQRFAAITSSQLSSLLGETSITSSDFNTVKALVQGEVDTYMGFKFIRTELLDLQVDALTAADTTGIVGSGTSVVGNRRCVFWAKDGLLLATADDIQTKIEERPDKNYATQVFVSMGIGATRLEEAKVVIGLAKES